MLRAVVPPNIENNGNLLGGLLKVRNSIEAALAAGILYTLIKVCFGFLSITIQLAMILILCGAAAIICLVGVDDMSFTEYVLTRRRFSKTNNSIGFKKPRPETPRKKVKEKQIKTEEKQINKKELFFNELFSFKKKKNRGEEDQE